MANAKKSVKILGPCGYLGSFLHEELPQDPNIELWDGEGSPDFLINCVGLADFDTCEKEPLRSLESNAVHLMKRCEEINPRKIINFSSYYVYDDAGLCKSSHSNLTAVNVYMRHKLLSEEYTLLQGGVNIRLGKLFGGPLHGQSKFVEHCIRESHIKADGVLCPFTHLDTVLWMIKALIYVETEQRPPATFNCLTGNMTHHGFAQYVADICNLGNKLPKKEVELVPNRNPFPSYGNFAMAPIAGTEEVWDLEEVVYDYLEELGYA